MHATGTFLTGDVRPQEIKAYVTFEKRNIYCNDTESNWWMRYHPNPDNFPKSEHSMTEDGFYIPQMQVGAEFKSMDISAPLQILQLTAGEKIGVEPKTDK